MSLNLGPMPSMARVRTLDELLVRAPVASIFATASDVEQWPRHLAHYRYVRFRRGDSRGGVVEMSANRPFGVVNWPTWWVSEMQVIDSPAPRIRFRHIEGITTGMEVEWRFAAAAGGTAVTIEHLWTGPRWPLIGTLAASMIIGPVFVHGIASRTLSGLALVCEKGLTSNRA